MVGTTMQKLGIDRLSAAERIDLALDIWESLGADSDAPWLDAERRRELRRRDAEMDADPTATLTWAEVRAGIGRAR